MDENDSFNHFLSELESHGLKRDGLHPKYDGAKAAAFTHEHGLDFSTVAHAWVGAHKQWYTDHPIIFIHGKARRTGYPAPWTFPTKPLLIAAVATLIGVLVLKWMNIN